MIYTMICAIFTMFAFFGLSNPAARMSAAAPAGPRSVIFDYRSKSDGGQWRCVNDGVMGGVSKGRFFLTETSTMVFAGVLSLENNGGFASVRADCPRPDLSEYDGLLVRLRGDGKRYSIGVRTDFPILAGAYYHEFDTVKGQWQELFFPFEDFIPRSFGRPLRGADPLNKAEVQGLGFIISDKQEGPFGLEIDWIAASPAPVATNDKGETEAKACARDQ